MLKITPISTFKDNYVWLIRPSAANAPAVAAVVDPGDADPVLDALQVGGLKLAAILITHHHRDHVSGVEKLAQCHKSVAIFGSWNSPVKAITNRVRDGDTIDLSKDLGKFQIIATPGHTLDHVCYLTQNHLFCGDTLFSAGCGRLFEGDPEQMLTSLNKIASLPTNTHLYPAHEYTKENLQFANEVEPDNHAIQERLAQVNELRSQNLPTLPTTLTTELASNPFLRCANDEVHRNVERQTKRTLANELEVFTELRLWKDKY